MVVSLNPQNKGALLLTTNTEVSIAPKLHKRQQKTPSKSAGSATPPVNKDTKSTSNPAPPPSITHSQILRVFPPQILSHPPPSHAGVEILGFVAPSTLAKLLPPGRALEDHLFSKGQLKRLSPPVDPTSTKQGVDVSPVPKILNPGDKDTSLDAAPAGTVYVGQLAGVPSGHIVFPTGVMDIEDWDMISLATGLEQRTIQLSPIVNGIIKTTCVPVFFIRKIILRCCLDPPPTFWLGWMIYSQNVMTFVSKR